MLLGLSLQVLGPLWAHLCVDWLRFGEPVLANIKQNQSRRPFCDIVKTLKNISVFDVFEAWGPPDGCQDGAVDIL